MSPTSSTESRASSPPEGSSADVNDVGISDGVYAEKMHMLIPLVDDLRSLGADAIIELPGVVVVGNQSAGKSSLVEALSGISVPRNANTCTRCPMECRLKHSLKPWRCQIRLRRNRNAVNANSKKPARPREENFGPVLTDKAKLELMIRRAQLAALNPDTRIADFVGMSEQELNNRFAGNEDQSSFSQDVVCLDISGPDVTNLSFIDLPGLISYDEDNNVTLIENMASDYIKGNTLILLTITMREDMLLQKAAKLARVADPQGLRTIGVLTKPDTLQEGEEKTWLQILTGEREGAKYKLHHGYFVTKQPALSELKEKITHAEARARERAFFESTAPWNNLPLRFQKRLGVPYLALDLNRQLIRLIAKTLPGLMEKAILAKAETQAALDALPLPPPDNPVIELAKLLSVFTNEFSKCIWGAQGHEDISQHCRRTYSAFASVILETRPNFVPQQKTEGSSKDGKNTSVVVEMIDEAAGLPCGNQQMFLDELHKFLEGSLTRELPYNVPFSAKAKLIRACFTNWGNISDKCFDAVKLELSKLLKALVKEHFSQYASGGLEGQVQRLVDNLIEHLAKKTRECIKWALGLEDPPFTKNEHDFTGYRGTNLISLREARHNLKQSPAPPVQPFQPQPQPQLQSAPTIPNPTSQKMSFSGFNFAPPPPPSATPPQFPFATFTGFQTPTASLNMRQNVDVPMGQTLPGYQGKKEEDFARLNETDPFEQELIVMAEVSAYFRIAYKRIIDNIPRIIDHDFLRALDANIYEELSKGLGVGQSDAYTRAESYLREDPDIAATREELTRKKERLEEIIERLDKFYL
ncbi:hypothetical protein SCHPADRAFT_945077 [Schizopora paradoxa]|uniref:P-loop containing nucleoside triphosphate hydrolase protein n=1 Tax=Schizopora paradoxa TaxID=27342 RepID=A0A0H2R8H8_9AGAM|nr:hypothetical protein SCHPADRAFT_945077 [Schizopora paradoxa]